MSEANAKEQVRRFYNEIGWKQEIGDVYQNARYEDLRPVSAEYISRCHLRVNRHLKSSGKYLLDAGSGPIQYIEYLTYSAGYHKRVCLDLSIVALREARNRVGDHGLYLVADVANLPFSANVFEGAVSLHTFHHLPAEEHKTAYLQIFRVMKPGCSAVVVNGWTLSPLMDGSRWLVVSFERIGWMVKRLSGRTSESSQDSHKAAETQSGKPTGTFTRKRSAQDLRTELGGLMNIDILTWRSINVRFMRAVFHQKYFGRSLFKLLFWLEEQFPRFFGENGQYPLIVIHKE